MVRARIVKSNSIYMFWKLTSPPLYDVSRYSFRFPGRDSGTPDDEMAAISRDIHVSLYAGCQYFRKCW